MTVMKQYSEYGFVLCRPTSTFQSVRQNDDLNTLGRTIFTITMFTRLPFRPSPVLCGRYR